MALKPPIGASLLGTGDLNVKFMCAKVCLVLGLRDLSQSLVRCEPSLLMKNKRESRKVHERSQKNMFLPLQLPSPWNPSSAAAEHDPWQGTFPKGADICTLVCIGVCVCVYIYTYYIYISLSIYLSIYLSICRPRRRQGERDREDITISQGQDMM